METNRQPTSESAAAIALQLADQMRALAGAGEWDDIEAIAAQLQRAVMLVPLAERRPVLQALKRSTDSVAEEASKARRDVTGKISELRRGQAAKKAYQLG
jgi:hypothetical protein